MMITLTRTGGFTGIPMKKTIDTQKLLPEEAKQIEDLVLTSNFFTFKEPRVKNSPDRFTYTISIEHNALSRTLRINENSLTAPLKAVIGCLEKI